MQFPLEAALIVLPYGDGAASAANESHLAELLVFWAGTRRHAFVVASPTDPEPEPAGRAPDRGRAAANAHWASTLTHRIVASAECVFVASDLDLRLRALNVRTLVFAAGAIDRNIETNVRVASSLGYRSCVAVETVQGSPPPAASQLHSYAEFLAKDELVKNATLAVRRQG